MRIAVPVFIGTMMLSAPAFAIFPDPVTRAGLADEDAAEAEKLIDQQRFEMAVPLLRSALSRHPGNADLHNAMGFALRKTGRLDESYRHYTTALELDPGHRSAREYLGELFLMRNEPAKAREQLDMLIRLCPDGCEERQELEDALSRHPGGG